MTDPVILRTPGVRRRTPRTPDGPLFFLVIYGPHIIFWKLFSSCHDVVVKQLVCCCKIHGVRHNRVKYGPLIQFFFKISTICITLYYDWLLHSCWIHRKTHLLSEPIMVSVWWLPHFLSNCNHTAVLINLQTSAKDSTKRPLTGSLLVDFSAPAFGSKSAGSSSSTFVLMICWDLNSFEVVVKKPKWKFFLLITLLFNNNFSLLVFWFLLKNYINSSNIWEQKLKRRTQLTCCQKL